jgi:hypothetical protein
MFEVLEKDKRSVIIILFFVYIQGWSRHFNGRELNKFFFLLSKG